ncbi:gluconate 2-dehydrogenase subunit 3 family protein [Marinobacterium lutimaris]|uniref:Gluconate 2-dehydrogenase gamma chain n=1 Tax=Marinobacterium lutimaris TaxID=568106 RepID=A0A1H5X968_9GAMM|nr:gluconate 2-dehydrogenase subunit 3 family protein [Marinobacterium lutimaris]SEG07786.1 gluconate 2-dehydrogenase gamma chain [Marinobacterium lutimaris]
MSEHIDNEERRKFIRSSLSIIPAVSLTSTLGMPSWANAATEAVDLDAYQPVFFNTEEWKFLLAACDRLIPAEGDGPGALEANVPVFIDNELNGSFGRAADWYMQAPFDESVSPLFGYQSPLTPAETYRKGIAAVNAYTADTAGKPFAELSESQRDEVLAALQNGDIELDGVSARNFFGFLLQNTKEGYFADPIHGGNKDMAAWKMIGFPGARASYLEWVDQKDRSYPLGPVNINGDRG